jgi:hypothetical protein
MFRLLGDHSLYTFIVGLLGQIERVEIGHEVRRYTACDQRDDADAQGREFETPAFAGGDEGGF